MAITDSDKSDAAGETDAAHAEFERVLRNLVNTPHKPHSEKGSEPKPAPKSKV